MVAGCVNFGADAIGPGVVPARQPGHLPVGELDGTAPRGSTRWPRTSPTRRRPTDVIGYIWGKEAYGATLFATAVSDLAIHEVFDDPAYRPLLLAVAREVLAQAPVRPLPLDGFDPDDLPGRWPGWPTSTGSRPRRTRGSTAT